MFELRQAKESDRDFLFEVHRAALGTYVAATWGWDEDQQRRMFMERFRPGGLQVVQHRDQDVGFLEVHDHPDHIQVSTIELLPEAQGHGIGSAFLTGVLDAPANRGAKVSLRVLKTNRAKSLYDRLGFEVVTETETHYEMEAAPETA